MDNLADVDLDQKQPYSDLKQNFFRLRRNGKNNDRNAMEIVNILGGVDHILQAYFDNEIPFDSHAQTQLNAIFSNNGQNDKISQRHVVYYDGIKVDYILDADNDFLPSKYRGFLLQCLHNPWVQFGVFFLVLFNHLIADSPLPFLNWYHNIRWISEILIVWPFMFLRIVCG
eukprot:388010_1